MDTKSFTESRPASSRPRTAGVLLVCAGLSLLWLHLVGSYRDVDARPDLQWPDSTLSGAYKQGEIVWTLCPDSDRELAVDCGVPKDYFDATSGSSSIAFARLNASVTPSKGAVFLNPGGPGGSGMNLLLRGGAYLSELIGHEWDLIGFDPRGIGMTRPATKCFASELDEQIFNSNTIIEQGVTVSSIANFSGPSLLADLEQQSRQFIAMKQSQGAICGSVMGDELKYMGTASVVRDIDFMSQVFGGKGAKINFWGASYGSILGAYLVNMLPQRIGYALIDGIVDPVVWANEPPHKWYTAFMTSTEATYAMFLKDCSKAGPTLCPLTQYRGESYLNLMQRIEKFLDRLAVAPLPTPFAIRPMYVTSGAARGLLLGLLTRPAAWSSDAGAFADAMAGNGTLLANMILERGGGGSVARAAVSCADSVKLSTAAEIPTAAALAQAQIQTMREMSPHFGASITFSEPDGGCAYWPTAGREPERFTGPWNATLEVPMLIVSNTHDPVTPLSSARHVNSLKPNSSILIIQDGPGHCSLAMQSLCTAKAVRNYFRGLMPENGTLCQVDNPTFPEADAVDVKMELGEAEEVRLMQAWRSMESVMAEVRRW